MPEPASISTAGATLAAAPAAVSALTLFGVSVGLRPDVLIAGFSGALVSIVLLASVPSEGDTWRHLLATTVKRMFVSLASSLTAGYLTPFFLLPVADGRELVMLPTAFIVGAGAQKVLRGAIDRFSSAGPGAGGKP